MNSQLQDYIETQQKKGFSKDQIEHALGKAGWSQKDIIQAFTDQSVTVSPLNQPQKIQVPAETTKLTENKEFAISMGKYPVPVPDQNQPNPKRIGRPRNILFIILLICIYPLGLVFMWIWSGWRTPVKLLFSVPFIFGLAILFITGIGGGIFVLKGNGLKSVSVSPAPLNQNSGSRLANVGEKCNFASDCATSICVTGSGGRVCSEGKIGDPCFLEKDCSTNHCVDKVCTEGKSGDKCSLSFDCQDGLACKTGICQ